MSADFHFEETIAGLKETLQEAQTLVIYRAILNDSVVVAKLQMLEEIITSSQVATPTSKKLYQAYASFFSALAASAEFDSDTPVGTPWQNHLLDLILASENPFSRKAEVDGFECLGPSLARQVEHDLRKLQQLFVLDSRQILRLLEQIFPGSAWIDWSEFRSQAQTGDIRASSKLTVKRQLHQSADWSACLSLLASFYSQTGAGIFGRFRAFYWKRGVTGGGYLEGIPFPDPIRLDDLIGCEDQKEWLVRNTTHFLLGYPANNVFVCGDRGTGKSSAIKALVHHFADRTLRIIEISRDDLGDLHDVMKILRPRREYFIIFIDDLSFEEGETQYKTLKATLEGSLEARPENVLIYATSNRRHLIKEYFSDRETYSNEEVRHQDTLQEKVSLADRFGIQLVFIAPDQSQYLAIVRSLAQAREIRIPLEDLEKRALQWAQLHNGRSGRTARQFMDFLTAELKLDLK